VCLLWIGNRTRRFPDHGRPPIEISRSLRWLCGSDQRTARLSRASCMTPPSRDSFPAIFALLARANGACLVDPSWTGDLGTGLGRSNVRRIAVVPAITHLSTHLMLRSYRRRRSRRVRRPRRSRRRSARRRSAPHERTQWEESASAGCCESRLAVGADVLEEEVAKGDCLNQGEGWRGERLGHACRDHESNERKEAPMPREKTDPEESFSF
jgi:hypothetical protein